MPEYTNAETDQVEESEERPLSVPVFRHVARVVLASFLLTFVASRAMVVLIELRKVPDFYFHAHGTHVHHLNYGIFTLSAVGGYLIFRRPSGKRLTWATVVYGIGLGLTFDEFGMWVHLGGSYWQGASFDAVVIIAAVLGLLAYAPSVKRFQTLHWFWTLLIVGVVIVAGGALGLSAVDRYVTRIAPWLQKIEDTGPT